MENFGVLICSDTSVITNHTFTFQIHVKVFRKQFFCLSKDSFQNPHIRIAKKAHDASQKGGGGAEKTAKKNPPFFM